MAAADTSLIVVFGSDFNYPLGDVIPLSVSLTGFLADGGPITSSLARASTARIVLAQDSDTDGDEVTDGFDNSYRYR